MLLAIMSKNINAIRAYASAGGKAAARKKALLKQIALALETLQPNVPPPVWEEHELADAFKHAEDNPGNAEDYDLDAEFEIALKRLENANR